MIAIKIPSARTSWKQLKEKHFLSHLQTVDGRNFATATMASETSVSEVIVNIPVIHLQTPVPPISMLKTGLYKSCEIISGRTTSSHVHETAPPQLWYWGYGGERKVQQIAIINLVAKFLPSTVLSRMRLIGFNNHCHEKLNFLLQEICLLQLRNFFRQLSGNATKMVFLSSVFRKFLALGILIRTCSVGQPYPRCTYRKCTREALYMVTHLVVKMVGHTMHSAFAPALIRNGFGWFCCFSWIQWRLASVG